jgi:hypothetical protein
MKKKNKYRKTKQKKLSVSEPGSIYGKTGAKDVHIFSSFSEMEENNFKWLAALTPHQHLQNAVALIKRIFADDLKRKPKIGNRLIID